MRKITFNFWVTYLKVISLFFAALGMMWLLIGSFDPLGIYDREFAKAFWGSETLPADAKTAFQFVLGPFGSTTAGYFILQYFIAKHAYANRQLWGYNAILTAFFTWFISDTLFSLYKGAYFNVMLANVPSLLAMLPIVFTKKFFKNQDLSKQRDK